MQGQKFRDHIVIQIIVLSNQKMQPLTDICIGRARGGLTGCCYSWCTGKWKADGKFCSFSDFTLDIDAAIHQIDKFADNGQAKATAPDTVDTGINFTGKFIIYFPQIVRMDTNTGITDDGIKLHRCRSISGLFKKFKGYVPAVWCIFDGV